MHPKSRLTPACALLAAIFLVSTPRIFAADDTGAVDASAHILQAEIALRGGDYLLAAREYRMAAELGDSVDIARQATRVGYDLGFDEEALLAAERWLQLDPDSPYALRVVAQLQLRLGQIKDARRSYEKVIAAGEGPDDQRLAALLPDLSAEDPQNADKLMRLLAKPYKDSAPVYYASAVLALQAGDATYAGEQLERAFELDAEWLQPKLLYARVLLLEGNADEAIDYTARIIGDDPDPDPDARMELALMYVSVGRDEDALSQVNQILLEQSGRVDALRMMAIINFRQGNLDAAWDDFEDVLASREYTMDALYYLARIADIRGESSRAIRLYSQVTFGQNAAAAQRRASALIAYQQEDPELALQRLDEFAAENPTFAVDMVVARAQLLASLERYSAALEEYDRAIRFRPDDESTALGRAELLLRMDRLDDAIDAYRYAAKRWPDSALTLNALGYTLADRTDKFREAEKIIRKALRLDPQSPAIIDSLGWVLYKRGDYAAALEQLELAYSRFADHEVAAHLIDVLVELDRADDALELLAAAEQQNPDSDLLKDVRQRRFPATD